MCYLLFVLSLIVGTINFSVATHTKYYRYELDSALPNTDYVNPKTLYDLMSDETPYTSGLTTYSDFKTSYFDNLTKNFGYNYKGSCGYIAIGMLLSYYDTFLNDEIIPETYDINSTGTSTDVIARRNSPGVLRDFLSNSADYKDYNYGFDLSAEEYYTNMEALSNVSLHSKLITIGAKLGYYDFNDDSSPCGTNFKMRYDVMDEYLSNTLGYTQGTQYTYSYLNGESSSSMSSSVKEFAIDQVKKGNPVMISIGGSNGGHVAIAYDYDSNNDKLYCNMGWNAYSTQRTIEEYGYTTYRTALSIDFTSSHVCANNYSITTIEDNIPNTVNYCYNDCRINTYTGTYEHSYKDHYEYYSKQKHKSYCACGSHKLNFHVVKEIYGTGMHSYGICVDCKQTIDMGTTILPMQSPSHKNGNGGILQTQDGIYLLFGSSVNDYLEGKIDLNDEVR